MEHDHPRIHGHPVALNLALVAVDAGAKVLGSFDLSRKIFKVDRQPVLVSPVHHRIRTFVYPHIPPARTALKALSLGQEAPQHSAPISLPSHNPAPPAHTLPLSQHHEAALQ